jgi:hypothetical protein
MSGDREIGKFRPTVLDSALIMVIGVLLRPGADAVITSTGRCHVPVTCANGRAHGRTRHDSRVIHAPPAGLPPFTTFRIGPHALSDRTVGLPVSGDDVNDVQPYDVAFCFLPVTESRFHAS